MPAPPLDLNSASPLISAAFLGIGLAASSGLRAFLPLLLLSGAAKFGFFGVHLGQSFAWLASPTAFSALLLATLIEIGGDKIPLIDHALDIIGTVIRPAAGTLAAAAVWNKSDPATAALLGLIVGAPFALGFHAAKATTRAGSTLATAGLGNPIISALEDLSALFIGLVSLLLPLAVPLILLFALLLLWRIWKLTRRLRSARTTS